MNLTIELELPVILPGVSRDDSCVQRLVAGLQDMEGVSRVHIREGSDEALGTLCIHYDPEIVSLQRVREVAASVGIELGDRYGHLFLELGSAVHARKARTIAAQVQAVPGVIEATTSPAGGISIEYERAKTGEAELRAKLEALGVAQEPPSPRGDLKDQHEGHDHKDRQDPGHSHGGTLGGNSELIFSLACGLLLIVGFAIEKLGLTQTPWIPTAFYVAAYVFGGWFTLGEAIGNIKLKRFEIDTLMLVAAAGAAALGAWAEGALLLFLFSLGHALEHYAMGRAKRAIEALAKLAPETARVLRNGQVVEVQVESLIPGDVVVVRPNDRMPADGFVIKGASSVDQAPVTGESIPVDKLAVNDAALARDRPDSVVMESRVFAGTINGSGALEVEVTRRSGESALARVVKMVSEAETRKSPTQRFTDKFERVFVPAVLILAVLLLFSWIVIDEPFRDSFYRAMAVLVAASPCALAIATPSAVLAGIARAARGGVLIKGGAPLEELGMVRAIAFDKTGTLTEGKPRITDIKVMQGTTEQELLHVAVAVEALSDHPLAAAIVRDGNTRLGDGPVMVATDLANFAGRGVQAKVNGIDVWIGKAEMFGNDGIGALSAGAESAIEELRNAGRTTMAVRLGDRDLGVIGLMDTPRPEAREALDKLRRLGIQRMIMISGDHQTVAQAVATDVGLNEAWGNLMPDDKVKAIRQLKETERVAMVGDGVNDAPAMASASVGIAMGAASSDVALETADVALMSEDLRQVAFSVALSRRTKRVIRQNVYVSLGVVALLVPATILGLGIGPAVAVHEGSTLLVVFNALRLLGFRQS